MGYTKLQIVLGFWLSWVPGVAASKTWRHLRDTRMMGWYAFISFVLGLLSYASFAGWDKASDQLEIAAFFALIPFLVYVVAYFLWEFLKNPAEMYSNCIKKEFLEDLCRKAISLHRQGNDLLRRVKESEWNSEKTDLSKKRDQWVEAVRAHLSSGKQNSWLFEFDDLTLGGLSRFDDIREQAHSLISKYNKPNKQIAVESELTNRLTALAAIIKTIGRMATESSIVKN